MSKPALLNESNVKQPISFSDLENELATIYAHFNDYPVTWLQVPDHTAFAIQPLLQVQLQSENRSFFAASVPDGLPYAFGGIRPLLRSLIPYAPPSLLAQCAPELASVLPDLAHEVFPTAPSLKSLVPIPLGLARMLPRQSEFLLRIITRLGWFIDTVLQQPAWGQRPLLLFTAIDRADRPTILTIYHLIQRLAQTRAYGLLLTGQIPPFEGAKRQHLLDAAYEQQKLLAKFYQQVQPACIRLASTNLPSPTPYPATNEQSDEARAWQHVQTLLAHRETEAVPTAVYHALDLSNRYFNIELILQLLSDLVSRPDLSPFFVADLWQAAGSAHAALDNFSQAQACFLQGVELAGDDAVRRARIAMYLALISAKRMGDFVEAKQYLAWGYEAVAGEKTAENMLERGWLNNVKALIAYRQHNYNQALQLTQDALQFMKPYQSHEAAGLKTNLVTNISILLETANRPQQALEVWRRFKTFLGEAGDLFDKHYLYREAGLNLKAGYEADAQAGYRDAFQAAVRLGDLAGMEASARALVCLYHRAGQYQDAIHWAVKIPFLCQQLGDYENQWRSWCALAACQSYLPDMAAVAASLQEAVTLLEKTELAEVSHQRQVLKQAQAGNLQEVDWSIWLPELPGTMLRWPSHFIVP